MNNTTIYFISADYIKKNTPIIDDVENTLITSHILEAQNIDLQQCIGEDLYEKLVDDLENYTAGDDVETLLGTDYYNLFNDYIKPFLVYKSVYYSFYDLFAKVTAKGVVNQTDQYSQTAGMKVLENMRKETNQKAEHYKNQLADYLNDNYTLFPDYVATCNDCTDSSIYTSGLYLGKTEW